MEGPTTAFESTVQGIARRLHAKPDGCAIRFRGTSVTNAILLHKMLALADQLRAAGIGPGTRTGVSLERSPDALALLLALWWRGAVYVPLDPALPRERLFAMCEVADVDILVTQAELQNAVGSLPSAQLMLDGGAGTPASAFTPLPVPELPLQAGSLAYILFTSGSTGVPKGVQISHGNLATLFAGVLPLLELQPGCRILGCASFSFDIAFFELLAPLLCAGTLVLADTETCAEPLALADLIERERVTLVQATPSHWQLLNALPWTSRIGLAISTGEPLPRETAAAVLRRADALWNMYGPTECTIWSSAHRVNADDLTQTTPPIVAIGTALPGYALWLEPMDPATDQDEQARELVIAGGGVGLGYCGAGNAEQTLYRSGDICRYDADGRLHYLGRRDSQVKHNGYRIELEEITALLQQHMSIGRAACLVRPATATTPSLLFACVTFRRGMPNRGKTALNAYLASFLPAWMLPQRYYFLEHLPLTPHGKLDRAALLALTDISSVQVPCDNLEAGVAAVFREVLDIESLGPCDSFMDAGGSSMLAATLVMTLNERLGSTLTLRQALATPPTISGIVSLLRAATQSAARPGPGSHTAAPAHPPA